MSGNQVESKLLNELNKLSIVSKESTNSGDSFDEFNEYMHVERKIQNDLIECIEEVNSQKKKHIIFLAGSSGDGKSHLFSFLRERHKDLLVDYKLYRDATESFSQTQESEETLAKNLEEFTDEKLCTGNDKMIIAINLGILNKLISMNSVQEKHSQLVAFVNGNNILNEGNSFHVIKSEHFSIVNFAAYNDFEFENDQLKSHFIEGVFNKVFIASEDNPFYQAYLDDKAARNNSVVLLNYELMLDEKTREKVIELFLTVKLVNDLIIPARMIFDYIHKIIVPPDINVDTTSTNDEDILSHQLESLLPNLMFTNISKDKLLDAYRNIDIMNSRLKEIDSEITQMYIQDNLVSFIKKIISTENGEKIASFFNNLPKLSHITNPLLDKQIIETIVRFIWLSTSNCNFEKAHTSYQRYIYYLNCLNTGNKEGMQKLSNIVRAAIYKWFGDFDNKMIFISKCKGDVKLGYSFDIKDVSDRPNINQDNTSAMTSFTFIMKTVSGSTEKIELKYQTFELLNKINHGYKPNKHDYEKNIQFVKFINKLIESSKPEDAIAIVDQETGKRFEFRKSSSWGEDSYEFIRK